MLVRKNRCEPIVLPLKVADTCFFDSIIFIDKTSVTENCVFYNCYLTVGSLDKCRGQIQTVRTFSNCKFINCTLDGNTFILSEGCSVIGCTIFNYIFAYPKPLLFVNNVFSPKKNSQLQMEIVINLERRYDPSKYFFLISNNNFKGGSVRTAINEDPELLFNMLSYNENIKEIDVIDEVIEGYDENSYEKVSFLDMDTPFNLRFSENLVLKHLDLRDIKVGKNVIFRRSVIIRDCLTEGLDLSLISGLNDLNCIIFHNCNDDVEMTFPENIDIVRTHFDET